jgi:hypothetical protein
MERSSGVDVPACDQRSIRVQLRPINAVHRRQALHRRQRLAMDMGGRPHVCIGFNSYTAAHLFASRRSQVPGDPLGLVRLFASPQRFCDRLEEFMLRGSLHPRCLFALDPNRNV